MQDKVFEVVRDPNDGALYLHIDPADLNKYSAKELKEMSEQFAKDVANELVNKEKENVVDLSFSEDENDADNTTKPNT